MRSLCSALAVVLLLGAGVGYAADKDPSDSSPRPAAKKSHPSHARASTTARGANAKDRDEHAMTEDLNRQQLQNR